MSIADVVILIFTTLILGSIVYFKWIKKSDKLSCNCSKNKSCNLKIEELRDLFKDFKKT
ncbi:MAG: hypothetical protein RBQ95_05200 [Paracholeplasma sp.]|nr:hypothetical protein [Paracholeplasma sp.]